MKITSQVVFVFVRRLFRISYYQLFCHSEEAAIYIYLATMLTRLRKLMPMETVTDA